MPALAVIIGQHVAVQDHYLLADQTQKTITIKAENTYTIDHYDAGKGTVLVSKDLQLLSAKHILYSLTLDSPDTKDSLWINQKLR